MEQDQLEKIKHLVSLFEERDRLYTQSTEKIFSTVGPTALEALVALFNVPYENVSWLETQLIDNIMLIVASITYGDGQKVPPVIQALSPVPEDGQASIRLFRVGLPLELIFQPKQEITDYLMETAGVAAHRARARQGPQLTPEQQQQEANKMTIHGPQPEFDTSHLSHEQIQQLLIFGQDTKGVKH